jgi:hypothetical protein
MPLAPPPWQIYRARRRLLLRSALAGLVVFLAAFPVAKVHHSAKPVYIGLAIFIGLLGWASAPLADFHCPQCGEPFTHNGRQRNLFTRNCLHCRHPRWAEPEE